jgi:hypothetical protein
VSVCTLQQSQSRCELAACKTLACQKRRCEGVEGHAIAATTHSMGLMHVRGLDNAFMAAAAAPRSHRPEERAAPQVPATPAASASPKLW